MTLGVTTPAQGEKVLVTLLVKVAVRRVMEIDLFSGAARFAASAEAREVHGLPLGPRGRHVVVVQRAPVPVLEQARTFSHPWALVVWLGVPVILVATLFSEVTFWIGSFTTTEKWIFLPLFMAGWLLYWTPALVAVFRRRTRVWTVGLGNLLWAWTVLGWLLVLWLALGGATHPTNDVERRST